MLPSATPATQSAVKPSAPTRGSPVPQVPLLPRKRHVDVTQNSCTHMSCTQPFTVFYPYLLHTHNLSHTSRMQLFHAHNITQHCYLHCRSRWCVEIALIDFVRALGSPKQFCLSGQMGIHYQFEFGGTNIKTGAEMSTSPMTSNDCLRLDGSL